MDTKRLFLSIPFPKSWVDLFDEYKKEYLHHPIRWIEKENLHLTLYFIGETPENRIPEMKEKLRHISPESPPFSLEFSKIDFAPPGRSKRMIWAYFLPSKNFENLVVKVQRAVGGKEAEEEREPLPHATLARFRDFKPLRHLKLKELQMPKQILLVAQFDFQQSELSPSGAHYEVIESFLLKGER
ncbi:MAG: RNA 2',3'-cyclic phosphodiesterase [Deltaproteobacteria bacterium]